MFNGFRGTVGGSVQSNYTDQPGVGFAGMMPFASEEAIALIDSAIIGETEGIAAGRGVCFTQATAAAFDLQRPNSLAFLPTVATDAAAFQGIALRDDGMQSDANGVAGYNKGRVLRVLRKGRSGGRVYVKVQETVAVTDTVSMVTVASTDGKFLPGDFVVATPAGATAISLTGIAAFRTPAAGTTTTPDLAMIELL